ncbi:MULTISPECIES: Gfo/Idh/MocA family protein [unclassified Moritella]|uniref:Gfo/Idh/MocA family protein n=1 Tax=unclassified Moritella TaxID=2637987 RepID=UPI001BAA5E6C|nr:MULTISPECIES: Gfo/Idh/MocA family oxidoreductase [unclassified Moritella]QUM84868.1 Gfo/Idh/MocA family oxidoreductase [Moritella sp. 28]QUM89111.1 Gfo/Idh/MocA family oxidoreductase [Moritella sp. 36]
MQSKNEMTLPIRWGIIGCGNVTELKSGPAYQKVAGFKLSAVMRRNLDLAQDYALRHKVEAYSSNPDDIINSDNIDAVYIATPPDSHKLYALKVAQAGKPCCIEKPLAPNYADSLDIYNAFNDKNIPLFVAYYRRSLPRFNKVKALLEAGAIGQVRTINAFLNKPANALDLSGQFNWRTDKDVAVGGYFDDLASHGLDLFAYLLGEFDIVKGLGTNQQGLYSSLDSVSACWQHKSGVTGVGSWNFGGCTREDRVVITGSKGEIRFSIFDEAAVILQTLAQRQEFIIENPENIQLYHVQNMREHLVNNIDHPSSGETALHTSWVMEQILGDNK